jgi:hypothetical protein
VSPRQATTGGRAMAFSGCHRRPLPFRPVTLTQPVWRVTQGRAPVTPMARAIRAARWSRSAVVSTHAPSTRTTCARRGGGVGEAPVRPRRLRLRGAVRLSRAAGHAPHPGRGRPATELAPTDPETSAPARTSRPPRTGRPRRPIHRDSKICSGLTVIAFPRQLSVWGGRDVRRRPEPEAEDDHRS